MNIAIQPRVDVSSDFLEKLMQRFGNRVSTSASMCERFGMDESHHESMPPDAVVIVHSTEEVVEVVRLCNEYKVPMIPYGAGTGLEGSVAAVRGGIAINMQEMNQIIQVNDEDMDVVVQPGVTRIELNQYLRDKGLFFPVDPGANATIGGMVSTRASGTNAVLYGTMRDNVMALEVVLADGQIIRTGSRSRKSAAGYDLTRLFTGAEGTLGIITEITLRLRGIPEAISAAVCCFKDLDAAVQTVIQTIQIGVPVSRIELVDEVQMEAINKYSKTNYQIAPTLFLEFVGSESGVKEQAETVAMLADENGGADFQWATNTDQRNELWRARHNAAYASKALRPNASMWATDVCVPISRLSECISLTRKELTEAELISPIVGHVGEGNFHLSMMIDHNNPDEVHKAEQVHRNMVHRAIEFGGTCTGEHGIGIGKQEFLELEHGAGVDVMRLIKKALDPENLMSPGTIFSS
ncbi:MAG: D-lactate dehydrogenase (cytochrome) [Parasphingorhabdus sp.]|jgi:D-lactate dehydrogenase (cytochrome)